MPDVVVVGAGPAGSASAALLANMGHDVLLLDRARFPRPKPCAEYLSPGAYAALDRMGVLSRIPEIAGRRLRGMELVAPGGRRFLVEYSLGGHARHSLSLARSDMDLALLDHARVKGAQVCQGFHVRAPLLEDGFVVGVLGMQRNRAVEVRARLVIGADGLNSTLARALGVRRASRWPRSLGLVTHYRNVPWPEDYGQMLVGRQGYVGVAPVAGDVVVVGLVVPMGPASLGSADDQFRSALARYPSLADRLDSAERLEPVRGVGPLARTVRRSSGAGYLLVGDAAGFFDPFTGEGIYRALRGAELAAGVADRALRAGDASRERLLVYDQLRRAEFRAKERLTYLVQLFVQVPALMDYVVTRLQRRSRVAAGLSLALGDLVPAGDILRPGALWELLRP